MVNPYIRAVTKEHRDDLVIEHIHPKLYGKQIDYLVERNFHGLILDLRLDMNPDEEATKANYKAPTLAQEIRTRAAEYSSAAAKRGQEEYPIVLWSTDNRLDISYNRDHTSHDLFDLLCVKEHIVSDEQEVPEEKKAPWVAKRLLALADGYDKIAEVRNEFGRKKEQFFRFLGFDDVPDFLDDRLVKLAPFGPRRLYRPIHEYARFIRRELLETTGPLIDKPTLAARLGIDISLSPAFDFLLEEHFTEAAYLGPFAQGWPRWWAQRVEDMWRKLMGQGESDDFFRSIPADERVKRLRKCTGLNGLHAAVPLIEGGSTRYWVVCRATQRPLDPREGFVLESRGQFPWQGDEYVSLHAVRKGFLARKKLVLASSEQRRAKMAKKRNAL